MLFSGFSLKNSVQSLKRYPARFRRNLSEYRFIAYLAVLGPGIIAANAGNDASGIATYSTVGAGYGYSLLWLFVPMTIASDRRAGNVRSDGRCHRTRFGGSDPRTIRRAFDRARDARASDRQYRRDYFRIRRHRAGFGTVRHFALFYDSGSFGFDLVARRQRLAKKSRARFSVDVARLFRLCYFGVSVKTRLGKVGKEFVKPSFSLETGYLFTLIAVIGTTITPFMQVFVQSSVVEKRMDEEDLPLVRADVIVGTLFACLIAGFIVISTAATLHTQGINELDSAATAAEALAPVAGNYAKYLFGIGLFGAAMLAMGVLPLATAYSVSEALGFEKGLSQKFPRSTDFSRHFYRFNFDRRICRADSGHSANQIADLYAVHQRTFAAVYSGCHRFAGKQRRNYGRTQKLPAF